MRIANRLLAVAVALALTAGGLLVAAEIGWAALGHDPLVIPYDDWYADARANQWDSTGARSLFLVLGGAGLAILVMQLRTPRPRSLPLDARHVEAGVSRRSLEDLLARRVRDEDGVVSATAAIKRHRVRVVAVTHRAQQDLQPRVESAARASLGHLGVDGALNLAVKVERRPHTGRSVT